MQSYYFFLVRARCLPNFRVDFRFERIKQSEQVNYPLALFQGGKRFLIRHLTTKKIKAAKTIAVYIQKPRAVNRSYQLRTRTSFVTSTGYGILSRTTTLSTRSRYFIFSRYTLSCMNTVSPFVFSVCHLSRQNVSTFNSTRVRVLSRCVLRIGGGKVLQPQKHNTINISKRLSIQERLNRLHQKPSAQANKPCSILVFLSTMQLPNTITLRRLAHTLFASHKQSTIVTQ